MSKEIPISITIKDQYYCDSACLFLETINYSKTTENNCLLFSNELVYVKNKKSVMRCEKCKLCG